MNYVIGRPYKYPNSNKHFILKSVSENGFIFYFECGHWCTDSVFADLYDTFTGVQNYQNIQFKLDL